VHVYTKKGKGFKPAEADPIGYHAIAKQAVMVAPAKKSQPRNIPMFLDNGYVMKLHKTRVCLPLLQPCVKARAW
jgi:deoxyxylulose-5-phosphate synthase